MAARITKERFITGERGGLQYQVSPGTFNSNGKPHPPQWKKAAEVPLTLIRAWEAPKVADLCKEPLNPGEAHGGPCHPCEGFYSKHRDHEANPHHVCTDCHSRVQFTDEQQRGLYFRAACFAVCPTCVRVLTETLELAPGQAHDGCTCGTERGKWWCRDCRHEYANAIMARKATAAYEAGDVSRGSGYAACPRCWEDLRGQNDITWCSFCDGVVTRYGANNS